LKPGAGDQAQLDADTGRHLALLERGTLHRIIPVCVVALGDRVQIELHSAEIRADGGYVLLRAVEMGLAARATGEEPFMTLAEPHLTIGDDVGTRYGAALVTADTTDGRVWRHRFAFEPSPPTNAHRMRVEIESFGPGDIAGHDEITGPWVFEFNI